MVKVEEGEEGNAEEGREERVEESTGRLHKTLGVELMRVREESPLITNILQNMGTRCGCWCCLSAFKRCVAQAVRQCAGGVGRADNTR